MNELLFNTQFVNLKHLTIPYKIKLGESIYKQIAKACPYLESLDLGFTFRSGVNPKDRDLMKATEQIPNLNSISFDMWSLSGSGAISTMARAMGEQLLELKISANSICTRYLSDDTMSVLGDCCKNLKSFTYELVYYEKYYADSKAYDLLSDTGVVTLVRGCDQLQYLKISHAKKVTEEAFVTILDMLEQSNAARAENSDRSGRYGLQKIDLIGYPFVVTGIPLCLVHIDS